MFQFLKLLCRGRSSQVSSRRTHQVRLSLEHLEDRLVPTTTNMTALALSQVGTPPSASTPEHLYLNFDGWTNSSVTSSSISSFSGSQKQIDDIVYQVSEMFAPFNVVVEQIHGNGVYEKAAAVSGEPGPTTIFIGGNPNNIGPNGKVASSFTPSQFEDAPHSWDPTHPLHSNPYNLAFVDPVSITSGNGSTPWNGNYPWVSLEPDNQIAEDIAHEAGHTFGLAHVRTDGKTDPTPLLTEPVPDLMAYPTLGQYFANQTFNITTDNGSGGVAFDPTQQPDWKGTNLTTQDSYTYLGAVLGYHTYDGSVHVVHNGDVDGYSYQSLTSITGYGGKLLTAPNYNLGSVVNGSLTAGDYNVYQMTASATTTLNLSLSQHNGSWYDSLEVLVYDQSGNLITTVDGTSNGNIQTSLPVSAGQTYNFVVGTVGASGAGQYSFQVSQPLISIPHFPKGINGHVGVLNPGTPTPPPANLTAVASALTNSSESFSDFAANAYQQYLGRAPSAAEISYWATVMQHGMTDEQVEAGFIGSAEYIQDHGGAGAGWVTGMYQNLLGRTPAQVEVTYWVQQLNKGMSTTAVAYGFAASPERESERVAADYQKYLGRAASAVEINYWVSEFAAGATNENVIAGFVGSAEYFQNQGSDNTQWLDAAYEDIFGRFADATADSYWLPIL